MSPLTHAVVGIAISQHVRSPWIGRLGWPLALALAFASHFVLDSIPHLDAIGPLQAFRYGGGFFSLFGLAGVGLTVYLFKRNRTAGHIWILFSVWLLIAGFSGLVVRSLTAIALIAWLAYRTRQVDAPAYLMAAILALAPDFIPRNLLWMTRIHDGIHYNVSWAMSLLLRFQSPPIPSNNMARIQNPYFQAGLVLELLVEAGVFLLAFLSFSRLANQEKTPQEQQVPGVEPEETRVPA